MIRSCVVAGIKTVPQGDKRENNIRWRDRMFRTELRCCAGSHAQNSGREIDRRAKGVRQGTQQVTAHHHAHRRAQKFASCRLNQTQLQVNKVLYNLSRLHVHDISPRWLAPTQKKNVHAHATRHHLTFDLLIYTDFQFKKSGKYQGSRWGWVSSAAFNPTLPAFPPEGEGMICLVD